VHLPQDLTVSDDPVPSTVILAPADPDARDEGAEFETDLRTVVVPSVSEQVPSSSSSPPTEGEEGQSGPPQPVVVSGFVHDLGPASKEALVLAARDLNTSKPQGALLLLWGLPGVAEASSTQAASKELLKAVLKPLPASASASAADSSSGTLVEQQQQQAVHVHTVLLGESTVEWAARVGDPSGELGGEQGLEQLGAASCLLRSASWACALLGAGGVGEGSPLPPPPRPALPEAQGLVGTQGVLRRESEGREWKPVPAPQAKPEPKEEEEEEEEEDDDE